MSSNGEDRGSGKPAAPPSASPAERASSPEVVERAQFRGLLYWPANQQPDQPLAAVIALPDPEEGGESLARVIARLLESGIAVMAIEWGEEPTYPEILAILPGAISYLNSLEAIDPERIGVLGVELGADLALRSASTDPQIKTVLAFAPYLDMKLVNAGLVTRLRRPQLSNWVRLVEQLASLAAAQQLARRSVRVVFGAQDRLVEVAQAAEKLLEAGLQRNGVIQLADAGHDAIILKPEAVALAQEWFLNELRVGRE